MNNFSPNMLKTFKTCSQKYWFKYIEKFSVPQKATFFEKGKKIHALAHYYLRGDDISKLEKALTSEEQKIWQSLLNNEYFQMQYVNSEYNLSCKIDKYWIGGRIDAIVKNAADGKYYILDYKTGSIPQNAEIDFQTIVYLLCASKKFGTNISFVYIDLKNNTNHVIEFSNEEKYENLITEICNQIENAQPLEEIEHSQKCKFCEYQKICY